MKKKIEISIDDYLLDMLDEMTDGRNIDRSALISLMIFEEYAIFQELYPDLEI